MRAGRQDRDARRLLLVRHQRPDANRARLLARRHRGQDPRPLHRHEDPRPLAVRDARHARRRPVRAHGGVAGPQGTAGAAPRHLRRARRRSRLDRLLPPQRARLRLVLAVPRAGRAGGRGAGGDPRRQRVLVITPRVFGDRGRRRAIKLGIDPDRLPPGQSPSTKFPVFTYKSVPTLRTSSLTIDGDVEGPFTLSDEAFWALPHVEQTSDFHCVTRWSQFDMRFGGVRARDLLVRARPRPSATHVVAHGHDGYTTNLPLEVVLADDA